jgi:GNAT superfamily N-acetyltransferase
MGNKCFLIELPGEAQAMGICWVFGSNYTLTYARYADKNIVFSLPPDAVFIGNAFVSPHYRRRGVYSRLLAGVASGLRWPTHTSQILAAVESGNDQSRKAHAKNGFVTVAAIYYVSFLQTAVLLAWPLKGRPFFVRLRSNTRLIRILGDGTIAPSSHRVA